MICEYCNNQSGMKDNRGGCISCGAPLVSNCVERWAGRLAPSSRLERNEAILTYLGDKASTLWEDYRANGNRHSDGLIEFVTVGGSENQ